MSIKHYESGKRMSKIVVAGGFVFLSGLTAKDRSGRVGPQTADILAQIDEYLRAVGADKSKLTSASIWLSDMAAFDEMNAEWEAWIEPVAPPARATLEATMNHPDIKVEIMAQAFLG